MKTFLCTHIRTHRHTYNLKKYLTKWLNSQNEGKGYIYLADEQPFTDVARARANNTRYFRVIVFCKKLYLVKIPKWNS